MNIKDLLCGMEDRAMDSQFLKDICAIYNPKDFGASVAQDAGFQDLICDDLLTQPKMQRHQENYTDIEVCNQLEQSIMDRPKVFYILCGVV